MNINLMTKEIDSLSCPVLIIFSKPASQKDKPAVLSYSALNKKFISSLEEKTITGKLSEVVIFRECNYKDFKHVVVVGLGSDHDSETTRQAACTALEAIKSLNSKEAVVQFDGITTSKSQAPELVEAFAQGLLLADYSFDELKSKKSDKKDEPELLIHICTKLASDKSVKNSFNNGVVVGQTVNFSRRLGDMPGNLMTPAILAQHAADAAKGVANLKVTIWDKEKIKKEKMGGLLGVNNGSGQDPRFIIMEYKGAAASKKPVAFVGKGLTFDCGGISVKPSAGMEEMKYDMCGGANVIGTILAIAKMKLKINVLAVVPATENLIGPFATKPGDVHTARNGKTFEVNNTDAEGRLILADALCYASEQKPQIIIDAATLTGAIVVALGNTHTGYFTRNKELKNKIEKAGSSSGESIWNMPLCDHHVKDIKGTFADFSNISSGKGAGSATAAAFLEQFVEEGIPWAHFDIAGTAWAIGNRINYCPKKGASGVMIRTFIEIAKQYV